MTRDPGNNGIPCGLTIQSPIRPEADASSAVATEAGTVILREEIGCSISDTLLIQMRRWRRSPAIDAS